MKKLFVFILMLLVGASVFAFEPKAECVTWEGKKAFYVYQPLSYYPELNETNTEYRLVECSILKESSFLVTTNEKTVSRIVENVWYKNLEWYREHYIDVKSSWDESIEEKLGSEMVTKYHSALQEVFILEAVSRIPFVTEENFLTLTKEEMVTKLKEFAESVK